MFLLNTRAVSRTEGSNKNTVIILIICLEVTGLCANCHARLLHAGERDWGSTTKWNLLISTLRCFWSHLWNAFWTCNKTRRPVTAERSERRTEKARVAPRPETRHSTKSSSKKKLTLERQARQRTTKWEECRTIGVAAEDKVTHSSPWSDQQTFSDQFTQRGQQCQVLAYIKQN